MVRSKEIKKDLQNASAISVTAESEGGKIISQSLRSDLLNTVDKLAFKYKDATRDELVSLCASLASTIAMIRVFKNSLKNKMFLAEELQKALDEEGNLEEAG